MFCNTYAKIFLFYLTNVSTYGKFFTMADVIEKLKQLQKQQGWSQERLAREIGVTLNTVNRWYNRHITPKGLSLKAIEELLRRYGIE